VALKFQQLTTASTVAADMGTFLSSNPNYKPIRVLNVSLTTTSREDTVAIIVWATPDDAMFFGEFGISLDKIWIRDPEASNAFRFTS